MSWLSKTFNKVNPLLGDNFLGMGQGLFRSKNDGYTPGKFEVGKPLPGTPTNVATGFGEFNRGLDQTVLSNGMPATPGYNSIRGADGQLMSQYKINPQEMGDSASWVASAQAKNNANTTNSWNNAATLAQTGKDEAMSDLGMSGGFSSGARERIAKMGSRDMNNSKMDAANQGNLNNLEIDLQGKQMDLDAERFNISNDLAGQQYNTGNAIADVGGLNAQQMTGYDQRMKDFIGTKLANAQAQASANANKGGGFLGSLGIF